MSKSCAKCEKTVYPLEELKCLDKIWHKGCFKCHECGMTLNMKTYKGFNKLPYCEAHIPKAKATTVADTPEFKRISENTKIQSNAAYHAEFEKSKGKFTPVIDDPESLRIKQNSRIISNVTYHGDLEKKALMEQKRNLGGDGEGNKNGVPPPRSPSSYMEELSSLPTSQPPPPAPSHQHQQQQYHSSHMQQSYGQPQAPSYNRSTTGYSAHDELQQQKHYSGSQIRHSVPQQQQQQHHNQHQQSHVPPHYDQQQHRDRSYHQQQQQQQQQQHQYQQQQQPQPQPHYQPPPQHYSHHPPTGNSSLYSNRGQQNVIYSSDGGAVSGSPRKVGSIADYDPMNNYYGSDGQRAMQQTGRIQQQGHSQQQSSRGQAMPGHHPPQQAHGYPTRYRALYDYDAQDVDEVSFLEGDLILECTPIEEGWLTGNVQRSGKRGMLPANYVAPV